MFTSMPIIVGSIVIYLFNKNQFYRKRLKKSLRSSENKGPITVAAAMAIVALIIGVLASGPVGNYTVNYQINPLTSFENLSMPAVTGGSEGSYSWGNPTSYIDQFNVSKPVYVNFYVIDTNTTSLAAHFTNITFTVKIYSPGPDDKLQTPDDVQVAEIQMELVKFGFGQGHVYAKTALLNVSEYGIIKQFDYQTRTIPDTVSGTFTIHVWAEEV